MLSVQRNRKVLKYAVGWDQIGFSGAIHHFCIALLFSLGTHVFLVAAVLLLFLHCGSLYHGRLLKLRLCCFKIQTQKGPKERLFIMTWTHSMQILKLFVFGSCFKMPAVILFQIFGCSDVVNFSSVNCDCTFSNSQG